MATYSYTDIADVFIPQKQSEYIREQVITKSILFQSGAVVKATLADLKLSPIKGGQKVTIPFWKQPDKTMTNLDNDTSLTPKGFTSDTVTGWLLARGTSWGFDAILKAYSGSDPLGFIAEYASDAWIAHNSGVVLSILKGLFATPATTLMDGNYIDLSSGVLNSGDMLKIMYLLGDNKDKITLVYMHSAIEQHLVNLGEIVIKEPWEGSPSLNTYKGKSVMIDDTLPYNASTKIGNIYMLGAGAFIFNDEFHQQDALQKNEQTDSTGYFTRRVMLMHPNGISFTATSPFGTAQAPRDADLESAASWTREYEAKNVPITCGKVKIS